MLPSSATFLRLLDVLDLPLNRHLGIVFGGIIKGVARSYFQCHAEREIFGGQLHGGVLTARYEVGGFLALVPLLSAKQHAVTHDLHMSLMRTVPAGARCDLRAEVARFGRTLAFINVSATVAGQQLASARITKNLSQNEHREVRRSLARRGRRRQYRGTARRSQHRATFCSRV